MLKCGSELFGDKPQEKHCNILQCVTKFRNINRPRATIEWERYQNITTAHIRSMFKCRSHPAARPTNLAGQRFARKTIPLECKCTKTLPLKPGHGKEQAADHLCPCVITPNQESKYKDLLFPQPRCERVQKPEPEFGQENCNIPFTCQRQECMHLHSKTHASQSHMLHAELMTKAPSTQHEWRHLHDKNL